MASPGQILAIDPGPVQSAWCLYGAGGLRAGVLLNGELRASLLDGGFGGDRLAVEMIQSYGMSVGAEVFDTCVWIGRFVEAWGGRDYELVPRLRVKSHLCRDSRAKDANIRQALIDRFGGPAALKGDQKCPRCRGEGEVVAREPGGARVATLIRCPRCAGTGRLGTVGALHGLRADMWSALAVAVTAAETEASR